MLTALAGIIEGAIIEGAKNNIAAINIVLTILRRFFICRPDPARNAASKTTFCQAGGL
jgi:hypothetical protein